MPVQKNSGNLLYIELNISSCLILFILFRVFTPLSTMVSRWSLSDIKSPQVSSNLLSILANLNNAVVWIVSNRPNISKSSSPCTHSLMSVPRARITIGITDCLMFYKIFHFPSKVEVLIFLFAFFQFYAAFSSLFYWLGCVHRSPNSHGENTTKPTKKRQTNSDHQTLWLGPSEQQRYKR